MKSFLITIITMAFLISCSESFQKLDAKKFNEKISERTDIRSPEQLMRIYYKYPQGERTPNLSIETKDLGNNLYEITLIDEPIQDDSEAGEKIVMTAKSIADHWTVIEIKENW